MNLDGAVDHVTVTVLTPLYDADGTQISQASHDRTYTPPQWNAAYQDAFPDGDVEVHLTQTVGTMQALMAMTPEDNAG